MNKPELSVIVPVYNEEKTLDELLRKVLEVSPEFEIIVVDNASTDNSRAIAETFSRVGKIKLLTHSAEQGKGAAIRAGLREAHGKYVVIQDGDLEYDPQDLLTLLSYAQEHQADAVFGSRILNPQSGVSYQRFYWGGRLLTWLANKLFDTNITDEATCYKMVRRDLLLDMKLECVRFEFCPEVVAKLGRRGAHIHELPVSYSPRSIAEGKKIRWHDGLEAIWTLIRLALHP